MPETPPGPQLDPEALLDFFQRLSTANASSPDGVDAADFFRAHRNHPDRDLHRWPIIASKVPEAPIDAETRRKLAAEIAAGIEDIREQVGRTADAEVPEPMDTDLHFAALAEIMLPNAQSSEQVARLLSGYIRTQAQFAAKRSFQVTLPGQDITPEQLEALVVERTPHRWANLTELARIPEWIVFRHALETRPFEIYALEAGNDGVFTLLADPREVYLVDYDAEGEGDQVPKMIRNRPDNKRMTRTKMARFFQFPGLYELIEKDAYEKHPAAVGNNLTVLAEFFCEQDEEAIQRLNRVLPQDIETWIATKLERYSPPIEVAWYIWTRLNGTEYGAAARSLEQYILDTHEREHPWLFKLGMKERAGCSHPGALFELYQFALMSCQYAMDDETKGRYPRLLTVLPSIYDLQSVQANQVYAGMESVRYVLGHYAEHLTDFYPQAEQVKAIDLSTDSFAPLVDLFGYEDEPDAYEWNAVEGFELLDPIEIFKQKDLNRYNAAAELIKDILGQLKEMASRDARILLRFKNEVLDKLEPCKRRVFVRIMESLAMPIAAEALLADSDDDQVVEIARGQTEIEVPRRIILPGDVAWSEVVGTQFDPSRISTVAERELLRRSLKGARGAEEISTYLMAHVDTLRPSEVVRPNPDAPHREIIAEYGGSPDLLALLDMATLLLYMGYDPDEVKAEIARQAEIADSISRPELASVGVESEMVGRTPEGQIIDDESFAWLFNVLPRDRKPTDWEDNETMLPPTTSPFMQGMLLSLVTDDRFPFLNTDMLWEQTARADRSPNSLHMNVSIPEGLPYTADFVARYMRPLQRMQWLSYGGSSTQANVARGRVSRWRKHSLLDVMGGVDKGQKAEFRNLRLEKDGSNITRMHQLQLLASACIQLMREQAGLKVSNSGRVMAEIYQRFQVEAQTIRDSAQGAAIAAEGLLVKYAGEVQSELGLDFKPKNEGIIVMP